MNRRQFLHTAIDGRGKNNEPILAPHLKGKCMARETFDGAPPSDHAGGVSQDRVRKWN